jgi:CBS-domain-containing membrane protein
MTLDVLKAFETDSVKGIARWLAAGSVSALPVVDGEDRVVGVVSEADLLRRTRAGENSARARSAAEVMTEPPVTVRPEASVREAARIMLEHRVKRLPVVDDVGRLLGIVSRADLVRLFVRPDEDIRREVREDVIHHDLRIDPATILVGVKDGIVVLQGQLERSSLIAALVRLVEGVDGVIAVENRLECTNKTRSGVPQP